MTIIVLRTFGIPRNRQRDKLGIEHVPGVAGSHIFLKGRQFRKGMRTWAIMVINTRTKVAWIRVLYQRPARLKTRWKKQRTPSLERDVVMGQRIWVTRLSLRVVERVDVGRAAAW